MKFAVTFATALSLATGTVALAQESGAMDHGAMNHGAQEGAPAAAALPAACHAAAEASGGIEMPGMGNTMAGETDALDPVQQANHDAMDAMHAPMMAAAMIKDADLAFNCGMIAHHRGAIAMAKVVIERGKDEASKALAAEIIAAQEKEIAEMTVWIENYKP